MAKATVICTCPKCGSEFKKEKFCNNRSEANDWEHWMRTNYTGLCYECWDAEKKEADAAKTDEFAAQHSGLPALNGSEKQIAWAAKIRRDALTALESFTPTQNEDMYKAFCEWVASHAECRWWIDNREKLDRGTDKVAAYLIINSVHPIYQKEAEE